MTPLTIRPAEPEDASQMADLINDLIRLGNNTAHRTLFDGQRMLAHYIAPPDSIACHVAENNDQILGFQALEWSDPNWSGPDARPKGWAMIATFVARDAHKRGIGSKLFTATLEAARSAHASAIDATIRADNLGGLRYYAKMGFNQDGLHRAVPLSDGTPVDRVRTSLHLLF